MSARRRLFNALMWLGIVWLFACVILAIVGFWTVEPVRRESFGDTAWMLGCAGVVATILGAVGRQDV